MSQKPQSSIIVFMFIMAIVMGLGGFLILSYLQGRPTTPAGMRSEVVNGTEVLVQRDKMVEIIGAAPPGQPVIEQPTPQNGGQQPATAPTSPPPADTPIPPTATPVPEKITFIDYVVQSNDTLYKITTRMDTSIALMAEYGLSQDDLLPGTTIRLPIGNPAYCPGRRPYAVQEGDTAFSIGQRVGITADQLKTINNLDANYTVKMADILCVP